MSGLARYLEAEGIATVVIGLIPQHVRAIQPPRALLVPFALGRPLGAPGDAVLQREVLSAALNLLDRTGPGPLSEPFESDVHEHDGPEAWVCPVSFPPAPRGSELADRVASEVRLLEPWFHRGRQTRGYTSADVSGLEIDAITTWLCRFLESPAPTESPIADRSVGETFKLAIEDLKAFYFEASTTQPGAADEINNWFWDETAAGELLWALREASREHPDNGVRLHSQFTLVPALQVARKS